MAYIRTIFDPFIQQDCPHTLSIDSVSGEIVAQSTQSDHFVKFPVGATLDTIDTYISTYQAANEGQIPATVVEQQFADQQALIEQMSDGQTE